MNEYCVAKNLGVLKRGANTLGEDNNLSQKKIKFTNTNNENESECVNVFEDNDNDNDNDNFGNDDDNDNDKFGVDNDGDDCDDGDDNDDDCNGDSNDCDDNDGDDNLVGSDDPKMISAFFDVTNRLVVFNKSTKNEVLLPISISESVFSQCVKVSGAITFDNIGEIYSSRFKLYDKHKEFIVENSVELYFLCIYLFNNDENVILIDVIAGFGKSIVIHFLSNLFNTLRLAATNNAARLIQGRTLHSKFGIDWKSEEFQFTKIDHELVICDEISLIKESIVTKVVNLCRSQNKKLVLIGDLTQLPPSIGKPICKRTFPGIKITMKNKDISIPRFKSPELCRLVLNFRRLIKLEEFKHNLKQPADVKEFITIFNDIHRIITKVLKKNKITSKSLIDKFNCLYDDLVELISKKKSTKEICEFASSIPFYVNLRNKEGECLFNDHFVRSKSFTNSLMKTSVIFTSKQFTNKDINCLAKHKTLNYRDLHCTIGSIVVMRENNKDLKLKNGDRIVVTDILNFVESNFNTIRSVATKQIYKIYFEKDINRLPLIVGIVIDQNSAIYGEKVVLKPKLILETAKNSVYMFQITNMVYSTIHRIQGMTVPHDKVLYADSHMCKSFMKKISKVPKQNIPNLRALYVLWSRLCTFNNIMFID